MLVDACYNEVHDISYCFSCWQQHPLGCMSRHVANCVQDKLRSASLLLTNDNVCVVTGPGPHLWQQGEFFLCPFESCLDADMRRGVFGPSVGHLKAISASSKTKKAPMTGNKEVTVCLTRDGFQLHLTSHVFRQSNGHNVAKVAKLGGRLVCGISRCDASFPDGHDDILLRLCHLVIAHGLPILFRSDRVPLRSVAIEAFAGSLPQPLYRPNKRAMPSNNSQDRIFCVASQAYVLGLKKRALALGADFAVDLHPALRDGEASSNFTSPADRRGAVSSLNHTSVTAEDARRAIGHRPTSHT